MTSVAPANSSEMSASTFSYAQAAKGQGAAPPSNSSTATASQPQDAQAPVAAAAVATKAASSDTEQTKSAEVTETPNDIDAQSVGPEKRDIDNAPGSESDARSESTQDRRSESRREEDASRLDRPWRRSDKATKSGEDQDSRKARRSKKGKASEKQASESVSEDKEQEVVPEQPKIELSEAPIPSVNIWHKRQEAHLAKGKPATLGELVNGQQDGTKNSVPAPQEASTQNDAVTNGVKPQRKGTDATRPERNGPRGSRVSDKEKGVPPPVEDAVAWPTPETAIKDVKEEKKKSVERADRSDKDSQEDGSQKPRQKEKWVAYEYVPTVSFETQLPQMRNAKPRGGRSSARDTGARATTNGVPDKTPAAPLNKANDTKPRETNGTNGVSSQPQATKRGSLDAASQKKAANADKTKDSTAQSAENTQASRPEGRGERGRGGYRGRGAHLSVNSQGGQHQHSNSASGAASFNGQGAAASRSQGPYSPPLRQGAHGQMFAPPTQRGRGGRNGAGNYHRLSLPNGHTRMPTVQAQFPAYEYPVPPMGSMPFQPHPYWDNMVVPMLKSQIEYYFSIENLCKDMYLRARMDSQGFVPLHFIAAFKRMRELSPDMGLIRAMCEESTEVEYVVGEDDCERLRRREGWEKFVLPMEDRDELARNHGPAHLTFKNRAYAFGNHFNGVPAVPYGAYPNDPSFHQFPEGVQAVPAVNGLVNGNGPSQLSADVPDFSPTGNIPVVTSDNKGASELTNGHVETPLTNGVHSEQPEVAQS